MSYKNLEIWQESRAIVIDIHKMTIEKLPKFEMYEEGRQIRKSSKSVKSTIVEGYGRRKYKLEYIFTILNTRLKKIKPDGLKNQRLSHFFLP